jgi:lipopolysaccharide transport system permease protein
VDFGITLGFLAILMTWYGFAPGWQILLILPLVALTFGLSVGTGLLLAALNVEYRDFRYIVPFVVQFGLFVSPIAIETSKVPARWRLALSLNPMTGIIDAFRWSVLAGRTPLDPISLSFAVGVTALFVWAGIWYFRRMERSFADVI